MSADRESQVALGSEILASVTRNLLASVDARQVDRAELLRAAGLSEARLADPDGWVPIALHVRLGQAISAALPGENLGLQTGARIFGDPRGALGYCLRRSGTQARALRNFSAYLGLVNRSMKTALTHTPSGGSFTLQMVPELAALGHPAEALCSAWVAISRHLTRSSWCPSEVVFEHHPRGSTAEHREFFGCAVSFGRGPTCLRVPEPAWELPIEPVPHELERAYGLAFEHARALLTPTEAADLDRISSQLSKPPIDAFSGPDELQRSRGARLALARGLLQHSSLFVHEAAYLLGFGDLRAFVADFHGRFGAEPARLRALP